MGLISSDGRSSPHNGTKTRAVFTLRYSRVRPTAELTQLVNWQRLKHHVGRLIPERLFVLVHDAAAEGVEQ